MNNSLDKTHDMSHVKSFLSRNNTDVHEHLTEISMPFDTRCSGRDASRTVSNRATRPMTCLYYSENKESVFGIDLLRFIQSYMQELQWIWWKLSKQKEKKYIETAISLYSSSQERNMRRMKKQIFSSMFYFWMFTQIWIKVIFS